MTTPAGRELDAELYLLLWGKVPCDAWQEFHMGLAGIGYMRIEETCPHGWNGCYPAKAPVPLSTTYHGMGLLIEEMRKRGYMLELKVYSPSVIGYEHTYAEFLSATLKPGRGEHIFSPTAVALAARAALKGESA